MSSASDQAANVAAFHALPESAAPVSLDEWERRASGWKARQTIDVQVGELRELLARLRAAHALPDAWDNRRRYEGKPDASRCGAELRKVLGP